MTPAERLAIVGTDARPEVRDVYDKYVVDHHGEIEFFDLLNVVYNAGARSMAREMVQFSDVPRTMLRVENQIKKLLEMVERVAGEKP